MTPHLPPEIKDYILSFAVPPPSRCGKRFESHLLRTLSLVNNEWKAVAQARLMHNITLSTSKQTRNLADAFDRGVCDPLQVKTLVLHYLPIKGEPDNKMKWITGIKSDREVLMNVARRMKRVQIVWCWPYWVRDEEDLAGLLMCYKELKSLRFYHFELQPLLSTLASRNSLSSLTSLSLNSTAYHFLTIPITWSTDVESPFPHLTHLSLCVAGGTTRSSVCFNLGSLAGQLLSLLISMQGSFDAPFLLRDCKKLETLFLVARLPSPTLTTLLGTFPSTITTLHLVGGRPQTTFAGVPPTWVDYLGDWTTLQWSGKLRKLVLWPMMVAWPYMVHQFEAKEMEAYKVKCAEQEVELVVVSEERSRWDAEDWDPNEF